jgi:hypothetical protein
MKSKLAEAAEQQLIEAAKRMTHEQRLRAFIELSRRMVELQQAGKVLQNPQIKDATLKASDEHR